MFTRYKRTETDTKVLLFYLILNNYDLSKIQKFEEVEETESFGMKLTKIYGVTSEFVDISEIEQELNDILCPLICSPFSFEYYSKAQKIYKMTRKNLESPLYINDMNVISKHMIITEDMVVSANPAKQADETDCGFMYFYDYVLKDEMTIGKWTVRYSDKVFEVLYHNTDENGEIIPELLYRAVEMDKTTTYKLVIYIIKKAINSVETFKSDNFVIEQYEAVKD